MLRVLILFLILFARTASAQMAVIDTNALAESIKQNATMAAILENGKALWDTTKEGLEATKQITDTVGGAVSLTLTAQSFITNADQLLQCVTPQFLLDGMNFEVTNICTAQDYIRQALDLPTNGDIQNGLNTVSGVAGGSYSWRGITTGNNRTKQQWRKVKKARTDFHKKSVEDGLANAMAVKAEANTLSKAASSIIQDTNVSLTIMEKLSQTNRALADIHAALVQQNILIANILQVIASKEKLIEGTIATDAALLTQTEEKKE